MHRLDARCIDAVRIVSRYGGWLVQIHKIGQSFLFCFVSLEVISNFLLLSLTCSSSSSDLCLKSPKKKISNRKMWQCCYSKQIIAYFQIWIILKHNYCLLTYWISELIIVWNLIQCIMIYYLLNRWRVTPPTTEWRSQCCSVCGKCFQQKHWCHLDLTKSKKHIKCGCTLLTCNHGTWEC